MLRFFALAVVVLSMSAVNSFAGSYSYGSFYRPSYGYSSSYSYGYRPYSYYGSYPSYSYSLTPYYGYDSQAYYGVPYIPQPMGANSAPEMQGYTFYDVHVDSGKRFPAGYYKYVPEHKLWHRYGAGYEYGVPMNPTPPLPLPPVQNRPPLQGERINPPKEEFSNEELQRLRQMLDMLDRIKKP